MTYFKIMPECYILICILLVLFLIYINSCGPRHQNEYFGTGPEIFNPEGYGEMTYYDNRNLEPVYYVIDLPTFYDV
jgi:hypothetical protein